jgi:hypothetical protein
MKTKRFSIEISDEAENDLAEDEKYPKEMNQKIFRVQ